MKYIVFLLLPVLWSCTNPLNKVSTTPAAPAPAVVAAQTSAIPAPAPQVQPAPTDKNVHICLKGADKRELEIIKKDSGCALDVTEAGRKDESVTSHKGIKRCELAEKKMLDKLSKEGFKCS